MLFNLSKTHAENYRTLWALTFSALQFNKLENKFSGKYRDYPVTVQYQSREEGIFSKTCKVTVSFHKTTVLQTWIERLKLRLNNAKLDSDAMKLELNYAILPPDKWEIREHLDMMVDFLEERRIYPLGIQTSKGTGVEVLN